MESMIARAWRLLSCVFLVSAQVGWSQEGANCENDPHALGCGLVQSVPAPMMLFSSGGCNRMAPVSTITIGERVFSSRKIYAVSNEDSMCYSVSAMPEVEGDVKSVSWSCEENGSFLVQTPFPSPNCTGLELLDSRHQPQRRQYGSAMFSQVLDAKVCMTTNAPPPVGARSMLMRQSLPASVRPLCVQSWQTMESEILELTATQTSSTSSLQSVQVRLRKRLGDAVFARGQALAAGARDRKIFFAVGLASGTCVGAFLMLVVTRRRSHLAAGSSGQQELSSSILRQVDASYTEYADAS